jgi:alpha-1,3-glucan synthase
MGADRYLLFLFCLFASVLALRYDPAHEGWNLNLNKTAVDPLDYWGEWENHTFHPSPKDWRVPFYIITLDRFVDGDPTNNEANGTSFEHDWQSNQFRFGGDAKGLMNNLDYIQGMGIKVGKAFPCCYGYVLTLSGPIPLWNAVHQYAMV